MKRFSPAAAHVEPYKARLEKSNPAAANVEPCKARLEQLNPVAAAAACQGEALRNTGAPTTLG